LPPALFWLLDNSHQKNRHWIRQMSATAATALPLVDPLLPPAAPPLPIAAAAIAIGRAPLPSGLPPLPSPVRLRAPVVVVTSGRAVGVAAVLKFRHWHCWRYCRR